MNLKVSAAGLVLLALLVGCGAESPEVLLTSAKSHLAKNDNKAAVIQIKNALQGNPQLPEARYLLGILLLADGSAAEAEVELRKAMALKYSADVVIPKLAAAMLAQGKSKKVIEEFSSERLSTPATTADLQVSLAMAYAGQGNAEASEAALKSALAADPGFVPALIADARLKASRRDFEGALAAVEEIIKSHPTSAEAWKLKGDIVLFVRNEPEQALQAYRKAIEAKSDFLPAHFAILSILTRQGRTDEAQKHLDQLRKFAAGHLQTKYFEALVAYLKKDLKLARDLSQQLLKGAPDNVALLYLAGSVELQANSLVQAEAYLARAVQLAPGAVSARRLLVATYLRSSQPDKALATLRPGQTKDDVSPELYSVAGEVYLQQGDLKLAEEFFTKASKLDPSNVRLRTAVAQTRLAGGEATGALDELQAIAESDKGTSADMALITAYLSRNAFDMALRAIDALERKQPDQPLAAYLRGRTQLAMKDPDAARKSFERALTIAPTYYPPVASLAALDVEAKRPEEARKRVEAFLARDPKNSQALLALAELAAMSGAGPAYVAEILGKAIAANPADGALRLALIDLYLRTKDLKQATSTAQNAVAAIPDRPELLDALGRVQQQAGEFNQAIATYNKLIAMSPNATGPYLRLAEVQVAAKSNGDAAQSLGKALEIKPDLLEAQRGLALLDVAAGKFPEALAIARTVQKQRPKEAAGFLLEGQIDAERKNWPAAISVYRTGLKQASSSELAVKLHATLMASGNVTDADKFANEWRKGHPGDISFLHYLGSAALVLRHLEAAEQAYLEITRLQPGNAAAFNNLAWVMGQMNKEGAIAYAEKANRLAPSQPSFMNTLAMLLGQAKQYDKAIALQKKVLGLQPSNPTWRMDLARLYIQSGDKAGARRELDQLAALGDKYLNQTEVAALLKGL